MAETLGAVRPVVIDAGPATRARDLQELWAHRELLYFLAWRDLKVRYSQTVLGLAWAILQPLGTALVFTVFFGKLAGRPSDGAPYGLWSYTGVLVWTFFAAVVMSASQSLLGNAALVTKVYFPRAVIPAAAAVGGLVDFAAGFVVLVGLMALYGVAPTAAVVLVLPVMAVALAFTLGVGLWLSALIVLYRDLRHVVPFLLQLWMFATPIVYPLSLVPPGWRWVAMLNPMTGVVETFRASLLGRPVPWTALAVSGVAALVVLVTAELYFGRVQRVFADVV